MGEMRGLVYVLLVMVFLVVSWLVRILVSGRVHRRIDGKEEEARLRQEQE